MQCLFVWTFQLPAVATDAMMRVRWSAAVGEGDSERERERESRWTVVTVELPPKRTLPDCLLLCVCVECGVCSRRMPPLEHTDTDTDDALLRRRLLLLLTKITSHKRRS